MSTTKSATGWTKEFPTVDGYYWYRWNNQTAIFQLDYGKVWGMFSGEAQHPPRDGAEWLGPITSADFEQLAALREVAVLAAIPYEGLLMDHESRKRIALKVWTAIETAVAALRNALSLQGEDGK